MLQLYILLASLFGLVLILIIQGFHLRSLDRLKKRVDRHIKIKQREEKMIRAKVLKKEKNSKMKKRDKVALKSLPEIKKLFRQAEAEFARNELEHSEQLLVQLLALDPNYAVANEKLALVYLKTERPKKAQIVYELMIKNDPRNALSYANLGLAYYKQNKYKEAILAYEKSVEMDSRKPKRYAALGQIYLLVNKPKQALENFEKAFRRDRRNVEYLFLISEAQKQVGAWDECRETLEKILGIQPYNQEAKEELRKLSEKHVLGEPEEM